MNHTTQLCGSYSTQLYTTLHNGFADLIVSYTYTLYAYLHNYIMGPFPRWGGGGGAKHFLPESLILARKSNMFWYFVFVAHGEGGGGNYESNSFEVIMGHHREGRVYPPPTVGTFFWGKFGY